MRPILILSFLTFGLTHQGLTQVHSEVSLFERAVETFQAGQYSETRILLEDMLSRYPAGSLRSAAAITLVKCHYRSGNFREVQRSVADLARSFSSSRYREEAMVLEALSALELGQTKRAWSVLIELRSRSADARSRAESLLTAIIGFVPLGEAAELIESLKDIELREMLTLPFGLRLGDLGRVTRARRLLEATGRSKRKSKKATEMIKGLQSQSEARIRIGVITSLSGANAETGAAIRQGLELAVGQHNATKEPRIELVVYDDQSDIVQAIEAARDLAGLDEVSAIIGPIESDLMAAVAVVCEQARVPVISPTAAKTGLSELGSFVFQANPDLKTRSAELAEHAVRVLGLRNLAILAPSDLYGEAAVKGISETVSKMGGRVIAVERFYENTQDFRSQLIALRRLGFVDSVLNGRTASLDRRQIDSVYALFFPPNADQKEEFAIPMDHFDALFLPVYSDDIKYIAPQIAFYNLKTQLLGGDQWFDLTELKLQQHYVNGVVFVSESFVDPDDETTREFQRDFNTRFGHSPKSEAIYSYDLMQLLIDRMMVTQAYTGDELRNELAKGVDWKGIHNRILWPKSVQSNQSVHILKFVDGHIIHVN